MAIFTVKLFGPQAQLAKRRELDVAVDADSVSAAQLLTAIASACPALSDGLGNSKLALNQEFADAGDIVNPGDEIALIGMLGGG